MLRPALHTAVSGFRHRSTTELTLSRLPTLPTTWRTLAAEGGRSPYSILAVKPGLGRVRPPTHRQAVNIRTFHATRRNQSVPIIPVLVGFLKTSSALSVAGTLSRIVLTLVPVVLLKKLKLYKRLSHLEKKAQDMESEHYAEVKEATQRRLRNSTYLLKALIFTPIFLFWVTLMASFEQTPLTGRWRLILLSPEEEDEIAASLAGPGWYRAVTELLSQNGPPRALHPSDWRSAWVESTLRRLEGVIPVLLHEQDAVPDWMEHGPETIPLPPPAEYPLRPRPRASEYLRRAAELSAARAAPPSPHTVQGPPYSLIVVDEPQSSNAFSYGFGPDGAGGIVVFSGFLDDVLAKHPFPEPSTDAHAQQQETSWLTYLFGSLVPASTSRATRLGPTHEQTEELAILLAHELAHLILSHHIETLSSGSVIMPGVMSIVTDIVRTLVFPVTMLFGPFINDAMAGLGKMGTGEFVRISEYCTSQHQEIEADVVSARLLAYAGFDPRAAVRFWETRQDEPSTAECSPAKAQRQEESESYMSLPRRLISDAHPLYQVRVERLKLELQRWEKERAKALARRRAEAESQKSRSE